MNYKFPNISGVILSGGKATRMEGTNKAFIEIKGRRIIDTTIEILNPLFEEILIVTNSEGEFEDYQQRCIITPDIIKNIGPLGGLHAGLSKTRKEALFFVACDMPNLHNEIIVQQCDFFKKNPSDVLVPKTQDKLEPLHSIVKRSIKQKLESFIKSGQKKSLREFFKTVETNYWKLKETNNDKNIFCNLNSTQDIKEREKDNENQDKNLD